MHTLNNWARGALFIMGLLLSGPALPSSLSDAFYLGPRHLFCITRIFFWARVTLFNQYCELWARIAHLFFGPLYSMTNIYPIHVLTSRQIHLVLLSNQKPVF